MTLEKKKEKSLTAVYNKVIAASAPKESEDVILELKDFGEVSASKAIKLKSKD